MLSFRRNNPSRLERDAHTRRGSSEKEEEEKALGNVRQEQLILCRFERAAGDLFVRRKSLLEGHLNWVNTLTFKFENDENTNTVSNVKWSSSNVIIIFGIKGSQMIGGKWKRRWGVGMGQDRRSPIPFSDGSG